MSQHDVEALEYEPSFQAKMVLPGLVSALCTVKRRYKPGETIFLILLNINYTCQPIVLNYNTGQRYDFVISYPSGETLWKWSQDRAFMQALGSMTLLPGECIHYIQSFEIPLTQAPGIYNVTGWNTAKEIENKKLRVEITLEGTD